MKRWGISTLIAFLSALFVLSNRVTASYLLLDSDMTTLLESMRQRGSPLSWFGTDWPLGNHFYRPVTTLTFELDHRLYSSNSTGFGWTNAIIAALCVLLLFWFLKELTSTPWLATSSTVLFALWHKTIEYPEDLLLYFALAIVLIGWLRQRSFWNPLIAGSLIFFFVLELTPIMELAPRTLGWLPGRTATVMTLFGLLSLGAYAKAERAFGLHRDLPPAQATDSPSSKSVSQSKPNPKLGQLWYGASLVALALALGSYEQAVMLPALLGLAAVCLKQQGIQIHPRLHIGFWVALAGYLTLRTFVIPHDVSAYQGQQFRFGQGIWISDTKFLIPAYLDLQFIVATIFAVGGAGLILGTMWYSLCMVLGNCYAVVQTLKSKYASAIIFGFLASFVAYAPMMFLKPFEHYYYLPIALRSVMVVGFGAVVAKALVSAVSPRELQAPPRPDPAPGSLRHR